jgi:hypothetical protein
MEYSSSSGMEVIAIVNLFRVNGKGPKLAAQLRLAKNGQVEFEVIDTKAKPLLSDLREDGVWSQRLARVVTAGDGQLFLDAVLESLCNSSYWHATVEDPTPTHLPVLAEASN